MTPNTSAVLIVCPQPILCYALRTTLEDNAIGFVKHVPTMTDGLVALKGQHFSMVLLDAHAFYADGNGMGMIATIRTEFPALTIIMLTDNKAMLLGETLEAMTHGAISKDDHPQAFVDICAWIRNGCHGFWLSPMVAALYLKRRVMAYNHLLTERELHIPQLLDHTNGEIASDLRLTVGTVKNYVSVIYDKLGVRSRAEALKLRGEITVLHSRT